MTSDSRTKVQPDVKLLPMPEVKCWRAMKDRRGNVGYSDKPDPKYSDSAATDGLTWVRVNDHKAAMEAYARANMAELLAENERLRGEVAMLTHAVEQGHATLKIGDQLHAALASEMREQGVVVESDPLRVVNRRAERLAEALRSLAANWDERGNTVLRQARDADEPEVDQCYITAGALAGCAHELRAALDQARGKGGAGK